MTRTQTCLALLAAFLVAGCGQQERPETTAYRKQVESLRNDNRELQQQADVSAGMLNITALVLVITGSGLGVTLFALRWTYRRRE